MFIWLFGRFIPYKCCFENDLLKLSRPYVIKKYYKIMEIEYIHKGS